MNDIPVFDPDTLAETPVEGLIDLLIEHGDRVPRGLFDVCSGRGEAMVAVWRGCGCRGGRGAGGRPRGAGRRFGVIFDSSDVARSFEQAKDAPSWLRGGDPWKFYDDAQIQARQHMWRDEAGAHAAGRKLGDDEASGCFHEPFVLKQPKPGRNDPCHRGSGRKFKKCCLAGDETRAAQARLAH